MIKVFEDMYARTRGSILIISHQERILNIADKIVVLADGKIAAVGTKDEILPTLLGVRKECRVSCQRSYYVGDQVQEEAVKAKYENGMLLLTVPKEEPKKLAAKSIAIE